MVGGPRRVVEADTGCPVAFVDTDGASSHVDSSCLSLCVFEESAEGFFGSRADSVDGVVLTDVVILCDHVDGAGLDSLDDACHSDSLVDMSGMFFELFVGEVFGRDEEAECARDDVVGVNVTVDVFGGEFIGGKAGGRHAGWSRDSSSCCC